MATSDKSTGGERSNDRGKGRRSGPAPSDAGAGMGTGMERMLGGGPDSVYNPDMDEQDTDGGGQRDRDNALGGTAGVRGSMTGGINDEGRADTGQARSSYPSIAGRDDPPMEYQGGPGDTTGPSGASDAGGGSDTVGGLTGGIGGTRLPDDKQQDKKMLRERYGADEGKASQHDSNIKTD